MKSCPCGPREGNGASISPRFACILTCHAQQNKHTCPETSEDSTIWFHFCVVHLRSPAFLVLGILGFTVYSCLKGHKVVFPSIGKNFSLSLTVVFTILPRFSAFPSRLYLRLLIFSPTATTLSTHLFLANCFQDICRSLYLRLLIFPPLPPH